MICRSLLGLLLSLSSGLAPALASIPFAAPPFEFGHWLDPSPERQAGVDLRTTFDLERAAPSRDGASATAWANGESGETTEVAIDLRFRLEGATAVWIRLPHRRIVANLSLGEGPDARRLVRRAAGPSDAAFFAGWRLGRRRVEPLDWLVLAAGLKLRNAGSDPHGEWPTFDPTTGEPRGPQATRDVGLTLGSGTLDPLFSASGGALVRRTEFAFAVAGRFPTARNRFGVRPGRELDASARVVHPGPGFLAGASVRSRWTGATTEWSGGADEFPVPGTEVAAGWWGPLAILRARHLRVECRLDLPLFHAAVGPRLIAESRFEFVATTSFAIPDRRPRRTRTDSARTPMAGGR